MTCARARCLPPIRRSISNAALSRVNLSQIVEPFELFAVLRLIEYEVTVPYLIHARGAVRRCRCGPACAACADAATPGACAPVARWLRIFTPGLGFASQ